MVTLKDLHGIEWELGKKKAISQKVHLESRLKFTQRHLKNPATNRQKILSRDETITMFWHECQHSPSPTSTSGTVKHGAGSIHLWRYFSFAGTGEISELERRMDGVKYMEILRKNPKKYAKSLENGLERGK